MIQFAKNMRATHLIYAKRKPSRKIAISIGYKYFAILEMVTN